MNTYRSGHIVTKKIDNLVYTICPNINWSRLIPMI